MEEGNYYYMKITSNRRYTQNLKRFCAVLTELLTKIDKIKLSKWRSDNPRFCGNTNTQVPDFDTTEDCLYCI